MTIIIRKMEGVGQCFLKYKYFSFWFEINGARNLVNINPLPPSFSLLTTNQRNCSIIIIIIIIIQFEFALATESHLQENILVDMMLVVGNLMDHGIGIAVMA